MWLAAFVPDFDIRAFPALSRSTVIQQAPLGLPSAPQQDALLGGQPWAAPFVPDLGDRNSYPDALLPEERGGQSWADPFVPDFDFGAFPDPSEGVVVQQALLGLPPTL